MSGSAANGNGEAAITTGMAGPGSVPARGMYGNQDIGKMATRGIAGKKAIGNDNY